jgi:N-6 DNA Methylase
MQGGQVEKNQLELSVCRVGYREQLEMHKLAINEKHDSKPAANRAPPIPLKRAKSWDTMLSSVGLESSLAQNSIGALAELFEADASNEIWYSLWEQHCSSYFDLSEADRLLEQYTRSNRQRQLFFLQAYCKILLAAILEWSGFDFEKSSRPGFFDWLDAVDVEALAPIKRSIASTVALAEISQNATAQELSNFLSFMYQEIFPPALRHLTGEYYTPSWLVDHTLSSVEALSKDTPTIIFDPAAGSGGFLVHYVERTSAGASHPIKIVAADINPLAVEFCQANLAVAKGRQAERSVESLVLLADTIFDPVVERSSGPLFGTSKDYEKVLFSEQFVRDQDWSSTIQVVCKKFGLTKKARQLFASALSRYLTDSFMAVESFRADLIIGNPPWMTWDALRREYRDKLALQWSLSTLITQKGWRAKVAAGKTDLSTLFVYRAAQRHAAPHAMMGFVLPLSLFQSRHAGAGFRRFSTTEGREYGLLSLNDFSDVKVFGDAANRPAVAIFEVDKKSTYPTPYLEWVNDGTRGSISKIEKLCQPIDKDDPCSPIVALPKGDTTSLAGIGKSQYQARGGVNTGGANTILWLNVLGTDQSLLQVQNVGVTKKARSEVRDGWAEEAVVHPMIVGLDVVRWKAQPSKHLLLFYSPDRPKKAMDEAKVREQFPNAYKFACQFRDELLARKEYHRWGGVGPFYEVYRIGPYTFSPIKVVWQHTGFRGRLRVAVIDDRDRAITIPDQKVILIPSKDIDEAHYICAFLSSNFVSTTLQKYLGTDASTHILDYIGLRLYSAANEHHRQLAALSQAAHQAALRGSSTEPFEIEIDAIVDNMRASN